MAGHAIRSQKWGDITHNVDTSLELLEKVLELLEELREDYSYSPSASDRVETLTEISSEVESAIGQVERVRSLLN